MSNNISIAGWYLSTKKRQRKFPPQKKKNNTKQKDGLGYNDLSLYQSQETHKYTVCKKFQIFNFKAHISTTAT